MPTVRSGGVVPDAATFLTLRRNTIAMVFQADVLEIICGINVPKPLRDSYQFRELVRCFADITAWHNDVYGLAKDIADGQTCNVVRVTAASEECDLGTAAARVLDRAMTRQRLFLAIEARLPELANLLDLPPEAAEQARNLAGRLRAYTHTNLVWAEKTHRYDLDRPRIDGTFGDHPLWVAEYGVSEPRLPAGWTAWHLWQFQENAAVAGVEKGADRSHVNRSGVDLAALIIPG